MSHEIETMAAVGNTWHNLHTQATEADVYSIPNFLGLSGLNWRVHLVPLVTMGDAAQVVDHKAVQRASDGKILGVVGPRFQPIQNEEAFNWFAPFLEAKEAKLDAAGALKEGKVVWISAKLNRDPMEIVPGDTVEKYILLSHGHDGSLAVRAGYTPQRTVCWNTLSMAHSSSASRLIRLKHTVNVMENLVNVREIMNVANAEFEATAEQYRLLARRDINQADLRKYVKVVLKVAEIIDDPSKKEEEISTRQANIIEEIVKLAETGKGNQMPGVRGTYWMAFNAMTDYLSHEASRNADNRQYSLWFGPNATVNSRALEIALQMAS